MRASSNANTQADAGRPGRGAVQVLLVEPDAELAGTCAAVLQHDGFVVTVARTVDEGLTRLGRQVFDVIVTADQVGRRSGLELVAAARARHAATLVILTADDPSVAASVEALRAGAWEYLPKPFSAAHLQVLMARAAQAVRASHDHGIVAAGRDAQPARVADRAATAELLGAAPAFRAALELAARAAPTDAAVCVRGESGTGKEAVARLIHAMSRRAEGPFVLVNCTASGEARFDTELFGHQTGAGANGAGPESGLVRAARGGTLFLDELLALPARVQAQLLRVLQDEARTVADAHHPEGGIRVIAATTGDMDRARAEGELRDDLYYWLRVVTIDLPPLRARIDDIPVLADHFLARFWRRRGGDPSRVPELTTAAVELLARHPWPGNVRELQTVIEHAVVLAEPDAFITPDDLMLVSAAHLPPRVHAEPAAFSESYHAARDRVIAEFETRYLEWLVARSGGNLSRAARVAGVDRTTLYRVMERHGLQHLQHNPWRSGRTRGAALNDAPVN